MDIEDAKLELKRIREEYSKKYYKFWKSLISKNDQIVFDFTNDKGNWYEVEIQAFYDGKEGRTIRVCFSIDNGKGWRAFIPLTCSYIIDDDDKFVDFPPIPYQPFWNTESRLPPIVVVILPVIIAVLAFLILSYFIK